MPKLYDSRHDPILPGHWMCPSCFHQNPGKFEEGCICKKCGYKRTTHLVESYPSPFKSEYERQAWLRKKDAEKKEKHRAATLRNQKDRWIAPGKAKVTSKKFGELVVPCASTLSALMCAAEMWGCQHWTDIMPASVDAVDG